MYGREQTKDHAFHSCVFICCIISLRAVDLILDNLHKWRWCYNWNILTSYEKITLEKEPYLHWKMGLTLRVERKYAFLVVIQTSALIEVYQGDKFPGMLWSGVAFLPSLPPSTQPVLSKQPQMEMWAPYCWDKRDLCELQAVSLSAEWRRTVCTGVWAACLE